MKIRLLLKRLNLVIYQFVLKGPATFSAALKARWGRVMKTIASTHFECIRIFAAIMLLFLFLQIWRDFCHDNASVCLTPSGLFFKQNKYITNLYIFSAMWSFSSLKNLKEMTHEKIFEDGLHLKV